MVMTPFHEFGGFHGNFNNGYGGGAQMPFNNNFGNNFPRIAPNMFQADQNQWRGGFQNNNNVGYA
jgi:hypothetical protein